MTVGQDIFRAAVLDPAAMAPAGLVDPQGRPAGKRFDVYRNNVAVSLTEALGQAFPIIRKLVGQTNFQILAGTFLRVHPPKDPLVALYGDDMPAFLEGFESTRNLPYLPDMARLECAMRRSYHAADSIPADLNGLGAMDPAQLMATHLTLSPATRLIRSKWPIHGIWRANTEKDAPKVQMSADDVLITRPDYDPQPILLPPGGGAFIAQLRTEPLGSAFEAAQADAPDFDLTTTLGLLIAGNAIAHVA
ncbi:DNA-binding domain-containing protein [Actibacterium sp. 188UL27-1]|uniref:HvfC/BufC N-terminal domain-containing protein n=1 Tax=Actibacterium sp. 188UL27-1 TaxID=2786961 RepID=UPI00195BF8ED|nr:DNA-binding domain-containing protein [Actibacterium sp. 188UL27-1]MBM7069441.1 putative DNA-binding domain-containing protein [Actibacterium sp. 188UL27-1]